MNSLKLKSARIRGEQIAIDAGFENLPINPKLIAEKHEIIVEPKPATALGVSGMLIKSGDNFGIMYATHIKSAGFQNFSIAHELGHYFLDGHCEKLLKEGIHHSAAGFKNIDPYEQEADHFAVGLLMPKNFFLKAMKSMSPTLENIKFLANKANTSLTSTSIRFVELCDDPIALILSSSEKIEYCFMSEELKNYKGIEWIKKNSPLPRSSETKKFNENTLNIKNCCEVSSSTNFSNWFGGLVETEGNEEVIGLGDYNKTLTLLSFSELPSAEELEEEEELQDSWQPRFKR